MNPTRTLAPLCILGALLASASRTSAAGLVVGQNFSVLVSGADRPQLARQVLQRAEQYREEIARQWLGRPLPPAAGRTVIHLTLASDRDRGLTWARDDPRRTLHVVYLTTDRRGALGATLKHEVAHTVLATAFPHPRRLPSWLEESIASDYDDEGRQATRREALRQCRLQQTWPSLDRLLRARSLPAVDRRGYAAACELRRFLLTRGDRQQLMQFGQAGAAGDWDSAVRRVYGWQNVAELEAAWRRWSGQRLAVSGQQSAVSGQRSFFVP